MKISASLLKSLVKKLSAAGSQQTIVNLTNGTLSASDSDLTVVAISKALVDGGIERFSVPSKQFSSVVNRLSGEVTITRELGSLQIATAKSKFDIAVSGAPSLDFPSPTKTYSVPAKELKAVLAFASVAAEVNQAFTYQGVLQVKAGGTTLSTAATNGQRLALAEAPVESDSFSLLLPASVVRAIKDLPGDKLFIGESDAAIHIGCGDVEQSTTIIARKTAKDFPLFRDFIPKEFAFQAKIPADAMAEALKTVEPLVGDDDLKKITVRFADNITVTAQSPAGKAEDVVEYELLKPDPMFDESPKPFTMSVNHRYISDFFNSVSGDVMLNANTFSDPIWLEAGQYKMLIAPIRG